MPLQNVNPGDLITAAEWNDLVAALNGLDARVSELEAGGANAAPRITQVLPTGTRTVGDEIRIYGSNFGFTQGAHSVFFGNTRATSFRTGSSDTLLIVQIPDPVDGATEAGPTLTMSVGNLHAFTTWAMAIKSKPVVTSGGIQFTYLGSNPTTPAQNASVFYEFELHSTASQDLTVTLAPDIEVIPPLPTGVPDPGLGGLLTVIDSDGTERPNKQVALPEGATKNVSLRLNLPNNTNNLKYSLSVAVSAPGVTSVSEPVPNQQVGQAGEQPDATVHTFEFSSIDDGIGSFSADTGGVSGVDGTLTVKRGTTVTINLDTSFTGIPVGTTNNYQLSATVQTPANGWTASVNSIMQNPTPIHGPGGSIDSFFDITAPNSTTAPATVQLLLTRQGATTNNKRSVAYRLLTST